MKHFIVLVAFFILISSSYAFAADGASIAPANAEPSKAVTPKLPKETRVSITGVVKEISDTMIMVERTVKGKTETMQFVLDKPVEQINAGDKVRVSYVKKDDKPIAIRVSRVVAKKIVKKVP
ncbi:MAG: hypothetical protein ACXWMO_08205, partial [Syntrophales bacterium]